MIEQQQPQNGQGGQMQQQSQSQSPRRNEAHRYPRYQPLCLAGLQRALDPGTSLYNRQLRHGRWDETWETEDLTSTCICLIGIDRARVDTARLALDVRRTLEAAVQCINRRAYEGGLGLLVWANAVVGGGPLDELVAATGLGLGDGAAYVTRLTSMEASWLLSGLLHEQARDPRPRTRQLAETVMQEIQERYAASAGVMPHSSAKAALSHRLRRHIANFADQIYAVQALAFASRVLGAPAALETAKKLAGRLCELQGPLGQWWWHYDSRSGLVAEPFPVYSVHQHAMAPMALMAVEAAGGGSFGENIARSHDWLTRNELGVNMIDEAAQTIWRDVEHGDGQLLVKARHVRSLLGLYPRGVRHRQAPLKLNRETRPYEWAWCLYAGAIAAGSERGRHLV